MKILDIKIRPWWKFWRVDDFEVVVELDNGKTKTVSIFQRPSISTRCSISQLSFLDYVKNKVQYNDQFYMLHTQKEKQKDVKEHYEKCLLPLVGEEIPSEAK